MCLVSEDLTFLPTYACIHLGITVHSSSHLVVDCGLLLTDLDTGHQLFCRRVQLSMSPVLWVELPRGINEAKALSIPFIYWRCRRTFKLQASELSIECWLPAAQALI